MPILIDFLWLIYTELYQIVTALTRTPYVHSMPMSLPFFLPNDSYVVVGFDSSSTVAEVSASVSLSFNVRPLLMDPSYVQMQAFDQLMNPGRDEINFN